MAIPRPKCCVATVLVFVLVLGRIGVAERFERFADAPRNGGNNVELPSATKHTIFDGASLSRLPEVVDANVIVGGQIPAAHLVVNSAPLSRLPAVADPNLVIRGQVPAAPSGSHLVFNAADHDAKVEDITFGFWTSRIDAIWRDAAKRTWQDHCHFYNYRTMAKLGCSMLLGSALANTSADHHVVDWYQHNIRGRNTDDVSRFWKNFGEGHILIPSYACLAIAGSLLEDLPLSSPLQAFGGRATRACLVGAPPMLMMQFALGASRPWDQGDNNSRWKPFEDTNAVSGHAFIGAIPFMTLARMSDNALWKSCFWAGSTLTALSRVNDNDHYLSQAILGWWMAFLACEAVDQTQVADSDLTIAPVALHDSVGIGAVFKY